MRRRTFDLLVSWVGRGGMVRRLDAFRDLRGRLLVFAYLLCPARAHCGGGTRWVPATAVRMTLWRLFSGKRP